MVAQPRCVQVPCVHVRRVIRVRACPVCPDWPSSHLLGSSVQGLLASSNNAHCALKTSFVQYNGHCTIVGPEGKRFNQSCFQRLQFVCIMVTPLRELVVAMHSDTAFATPSSALHICHLLWAPLWVPLHTHTHTSIISLAHMRARVRHAHTHARTHTRTHTHTRARTHTHTMPTVPSAFIRLSSKSTAS